ncbi:hypothetical protein CPJ18_09155 [Agrobacterium rosae]|uniref:Uncharacterized protein n=1 Tax=Agrobacterium rosae TaxID=1972867 RepID=A0AAE5RZD3_9HYPH|nr:hypothetical protein DXM21_11255 [Agrobacterium rosae]KAA3520422.1 hypothetical protein DXM25_12365 [Agrobacterium rosae]MQB48729.1 hypothetical protein [Agrobacterium rosae]POO52446.1 hypothetical protein CPJ18_09155 [Agrobacterium rosae]
MFRNGLKAEPGFFKVNYARIPRLPKRHEDEGGKTTESGGEETGHQPVALLIPHLEFKAAEIIVCTQPAWLSSGLRPDEMVVFEQYGRFHVCASLRLVNSHQDIITFPAFAKLSIVK